jgi:hypothetical protein
MSTHTPNEERTTSTDGCAMLFLVARRECQVDRKWLQYQKNTIVFQLKESDRLSKDLRQMSRWPEDWSQQEDFWTDSGWTICWIPERMEKNGLIRYFKCQVRKIDLALTPG